MLGHEGAVLAEDLIAIVGAVAYIDQAVLRDAHAVHRIAELLRDRLGGIVGRRLVVARPVAVGAPVALVGAGLRIEHHHAAVGVAVGGVDLLGGDIDRDIGRRAQPLGRVAVGLVDRLADLQHEFAVHGELEQLAVGLVVAGEPDEIIVVDIDAVLALGPIVALARTAPMADEIAGLIEDEHRRRRHATLGLRRILLGGAIALGQRARTLHHPDVIEAIDPDAGDLPEDPVVGQRLGPERVDHELGNAADLGGGRLIDDFGLGERRARGERGDGEAEGRDFQSSSRAILFRLERIRWTSTACGGRNEGIRHPSWSAARFPTAARGRRLPPPPSFPSPHSLCR